MIKKVLCDCGHEAYISSTKEIDDGKVLCQNCWMERMYNEGRYKVGCLYPEAAICPDRDPQCINMSIPSEERNSKLNKAFCFRGHDACQNEKIKSTEILRFFKKAINNKDALCPRGDCNKVLDIIETDIAISGICSVHGLIFKASKARF